MTRNSKGKILVVDDNADLLAEVKSHLEKLGYEVVTAVDGRAALAAARTMELDLVVLDINFPAVKANSARSIDGIEVLRQLRDSGTVPVLMLSATNISAIKVMTLSMGADDYVPKPFALQELSARIEAILRRAKHEAPGDKVLSFSRLRLDPGERRVWKDGKVVELTEIEFDILYALARRPEHVFTRDKLMELAWKDFGYGVPKAVDVHVGHIRKKIEDDPRRPVFIMTVRGVGYRFQDVPKSSITE
ncbi:MAG: response regulator transcription factor [Candidatus Hydrogenedentota bacterium]